MELTDFGGGAEFAAVAMLGGPGSGKTYTAAKVLAGAIRDQQLPGDLYVFDSEGGLDYVVDAIQREAGRPVKVRGVRSRSFKDLVEFMKLAAKDQVPAILIDSGTHAHRELTDGYLQSINRARERSGKPTRNNLTIADFGAIARLWEPFSELFINTPAHKILCGRAGLVYQEEKDEETGNKTLKVIDIKMKIQGEFGFEPALVVQMYRHMELDPGRKRVKAVERHALVVKSRFDFMDGKLFVNPTYEDFKPFFDGLAGKHATIDTEVKTDPRVDVAGRDGFELERRARDVMIEEIRGELTARYPGAVGKDAATKFDITYRHLGTRSWSALEAYTSERLRKGLQDIRRELGTKAPTVTAQVTEESTSNE